MNFLFLCVAVAFGEVISAGSTQDIQDFSQEQTAAKHSYALYFTDKDEGVFSSVADLFYADSEDNF